MTSADLTDQIVPQADLSASGGSARGGGSMASCQVKLCETLRSRTGEEGSKDFVNQWFGLTDMEQNRYKHPLPEVLKGKCSQADYTHWLYGKAAAHVRRDKKRGNAIAINSVYRDAIHKAVCEGGDKDAYTGLSLRWDQIRKYNNNESSTGGRVYKKQFGGLPTVDHVDDGMGAPNFRICSWRTNDCKNDLTVEELINFCEVFLKHQKGETKLGA